MLYGFSYAVLNPVWGWVADKISSTLVILIGSLLLGLGYLLIGPEWSLVQIPPDTVLSLVAGVSPSNFLPFTLSLWH